MADCVLNAWPLEDRITNYGIFFVKRQCNVTRAEMVSNNKKLPIKEVLVWNI